VKNGKGVVHAGDGRQAGRDARAVGRRLPRRWRAARPTPMKLYMGGKLKISGNVMASQKLDFLKKIDREAGARRPYEAKKGGAAPAAQRHRGAGSGAPAARPARKRRRPGDLQGARRAAREEPGAREGGRAVLSFNVKNAGRQLRRRPHGSGAVREGTGDAATTADRSTTTTSWRSPRGRRAAQTSTNTASCASTATFASRTSSSFSKTQLRRKAKDHGTHE
jgi:hypothetical protein